MARLLPFVDIDIIRQEPLSGPETVSSGQGVTIGGFSQSFSSPFGAWVFRFTFKPMTGEEYVHFRGWVFAQHRGVNAIRWQMSERDRVKPEVAGVQYQPGQAVGWSNGMGWSNGQGWGLTMPNVAVAETAQNGASIIRLQEQFWGHKLKWGQRIGMFPFYFGMHQITEAIEPGVYRIWPPLRKTIEAGDFATLYPVLAMRLIGQDLQYPPEEAGYTINASVTLMEVFDYDVRKAFATDG